MCKILCMSGLDPKKSELNWRFIMRMGRVMSERNADGLGYTAIDKQGRMFGERWLNVDDAFVFRPEIKETGLVSKYLEFLDKDEDDKYNSFGELSPEIVAITLHTRYATSPKGLLNTHPFVDLEKSTSVIHNGGINNHCKADEIRSTCDSERILNKYLEHEVAKVPADMQNMINDLKGYFACGIFALDKNGTRILDVFKSRASLDSVKIKELGVVAITTDDKDAVDVCRAMGMHVTNKNSVKEDILLRMDAVTGKPMLSLKYKDTSNQWTPSTNNNRYRSPYVTDTQTDDKDWEKWHKEQEAKRKTEEAVNKAANSTNVIELPNLQDKVEEERAKIGNDPNKPFTPEEVNQLIGEVKQQTLAEEEIETSKQIVQKHTYDPMNEEDAAKEGYFHDKKAGIWTKINKVVQ